MIRLHSVAGVVKRVEGRKKSFLSACSKKNKIK